MLERVTHFQTVWKCVTRSSILFICNTFCCWLILLSSLYIELALVCCTNRENVHCFGTIFPNLNFVFASICAARPVHIQSDQYRSCSTVKQRRAVGAAPFISMGNNQKQRCGSEFAKWHDIYTPEECADEWRQNIADLNLLENYVMNGFPRWFHHVRHHVHDGHWTGEFATVIWCLHCFTVSFRGDVRWESKLIPSNSLYHKCIWYQSCDRKVLCPHALFIPWWRHQMETFSA